MPKIFGAKNLSADEIAAALQGGTTTGTSTALVATVPGSPSLSDGLLVMVELHTATGSFPTLNLNSLGAKLLYKGTQSGVTGLASGQLPQFSKALLMFSTTLDGWFVLSGLKSVAADIPSTLNNTTFGSGGVVVGWGNQVYKDSTTSNLSLLGGNQGTEARVFLYGNSHASKPGDAEYYTGSASGAAHSFFDKNGAEQLKIDENGVTVRGQNEKIQSAFTSNSFLSFNADGTVGLSAASGNGVVITAASVAAIAAYSSYATTSVPVRMSSAPISVGTSFTTVSPIAGNQQLLFATVTGQGTALLEWDGTTLTKLAGVSSLVVAGSAGAGETAFRVSGGNLQAIVDTGTRNVSSGLTIRH